MKKYLFFIVLLLIPSNSLAFSDLNNEDYQTEAILALEETGLINGYSDNTFRPNNEINRAELVTLAYRIFQPHKKYIIKNQIFDDVSPDEWYSNSINQAYNDGYIHGYIHGYQNKIFRPNQPVTKAEAIKIICLIAGENISKPKNNQNWFTPYLDYLRKQNIWSPLQIKNKTKQLFTRGETVYLSYRILQIHELFTKNQKYVALTFDDGPQAMTEIATLLNENNQRATFFLTSSFIDNKISPELERLIKQGKIEIGSHSRTHPDLTTLSDYDQRKELLQSRNLIQYQTLSPVKYFRPPFSEYNETTLKYMSYLGQKMIMWDLDTHDYDPSYQPTDILNIIENHLAPQSNIIMHLSDTTYQLLPQILELLKREKYQSVTISELSNLVGNKLNIDKNYWGKYIETDHKLDIINNGSGVQINYECSPYSCPTLIYNIPAMLRNWQNYKTLNLEYQGNASGQIIDILLLINEQEWHSSFIDNSDSPQTISLQLSDFNNGDPTTTPNLNYVSKIVFNPQSGKGEWLIWGMTLQ